MKNPFDKMKEEQKYLTFEHGLNADSRDECPYDPLHDKEMNAIWMNGFGSKPKSRNKQEVIQPNIDGKVALSAITEDELLEELHKRYKREYDELEQQAQVILKRMDKLRKVLSLKE
jgi:ribosome modulation factor